MNRIKKISSTGTYITDFGTSGLGTLSSPHGIYIDALDAIYVTDLGNDRVVVFNTSGTYVDEFTNVALDAPEDISQDSTGNFYVTSLGSDAVIKFDSLFNFVTQFGSLGATPGNYNNPNGIYIDATDNIYIADSANNRIQVIDTSGTFITSFGGGGTGNGQFDAPTGIAQDSFGNFFVVDFNNSRVQVFNSSRIYTSQFGTPGATIGKLSSPVNIFIDGSNSIFVADYGNDRIQKFRKGFTADLSAVIPALTCGTTYHFRAKATNSDGTSVGSDEVFTTLACDIPLMRTRGVSTITETTATLAGSHEDIGSMTIASRGFEYGTSTSYGSFLSESGNLFQNEFGSGGGGFVFLNAVGTDDEGNVYTTDQFDDRIQKFDSDGNFIADFGSSGSATGQVITPAVARETPDGKIAVVDTGNNRIQIFEKDGTSPSLFISSGLSAPTDIAFDSIGNAYVVDQGNGRVAKFTSLGVYVGDIGTGTTFSNPLSIAIDESGNFFITDVGNVRIAKLNSSGVYINDVGTTGTGDGEFGGSPGYVSVDEEGYVYISDPANNRVQKFDNALVFLSEFGISGTGDGEFSSPYGIALGLSGDIFVADTGNARIQKFNERYDLTISGLSCGTTYHYRAYGTNADGTGVSSDDTFGTPACPGSSGGGGGGGSSATHFICTDPKALNYSSNPKDGKINNDICKYPEGGEESLSCSVTPQFARPIKYGSQNNPEDVKIVEKYLNTYEGYDLPVDGIYSKADFDAVVLWQQKYANEILKPWGLAKGTGYVFITSLRKIKQIHEDGCEKAYSLNASEACYLYDQVLKKGTKSNFVKFAQKALHAAGTFTATPDGVFGPITEKAVKDFQILHGISPDGIIGSGTGHELEKIKCEI
jgi:streptogramin lyase